MFKFVAILALAVYSASAAPEPSVVAAPFVAAPLAPAVVTAQSSQVIARNYNALAAPLIAPAPVVAAPIVRAAPLIAPAPYVKAAPLLASAPVVAPAPVVATAPLVGPAPYIASPYFNPYAAPLVL